MGTNSAAASVNSLRAAFDSIEIVIAVGICGGVPQRGNGEIILGDVVVSNHIAHYDFGSQYPHTFEAKGATRNSVSNHDPRMLSFLHRMDTLPARTTLSENMHLFLERMLELPDFSIWKRPPPATARVYHPRYRHKHQILGVCNSCDACKDDRDETCHDALKASCSLLQCSEEFSILPERVAAAIQQSTCLRPQVHFGTVASGNRVMKSATHRDYIARQENAIAFEMEGAGLWNYAPTLVIKGVCDYADSHKNKDWQRYACAAAASCMKAFLHEWKNVGLARHPSNTDPPCPTGQDRHPIEEIIDSLWFREITSRFDGVESAQFDSFRWIFCQDKQVQLERNSAWTTQHLAPPALSLLDRYRTRFQQGSKSEWDPSGLRAWLKEGEGIF